MKFKLPFALICLGLGFGSAWILRAPAKPTAPEITSKVTETSSPAKMLGAADNISKESQNSELSRSARKPGAEADAEKSKAQAKAMTLDGKEMIKAILSKNHQSLLEKAARELKLSPAQIETMRKALDERLAKFMDMDGDFDTESSDEIKNLLNPKKIDELLMAEMTEEQKAAFTEMRAAERKSKIDSNTLKSLGQVTEAVSLSDEQRSAVYETLAEEEERKLTEKENSADINNVIMDSMGMGGQDDFGIQDALTDPEIQKQITESSDSENSSELMTTLMRESMTNKVNSKVNLLSPHLTPEQTIQYRQSLEDRVNTNMGMMESINIQRLGN
jgi:hypothetical protein